MNLRATESVAHLVWSGEVGGIERLVHDLVVEQTDRGIDVTVVFARERGPFASAIARTSARTTDLELRSGHDVHPRRLRAGASALRSSSVVHVHGYSPVIEAMCLSARRPVVFTEHGNFGLGRRLAPGDRAKRSLQKRFLRRHVGVLAANSEHTARRLVDIYGIHLRRIFVVPNGTDCRRGAVGSRSPSGLHVAVLGRLVAFKRIDRTLEGIAQAVSRESMRLTVVGEGPLDGKLRRLADELSIAQGVTFAGFRHDVEAVLLRADVLVQSSRDEPFGLAILEACACGALPVTFGDAGGALEALPPDGIVVRDSSQLGGVLDRLVGSTLISNEARRRRREWVRDAFSIGSVADRYDRLYGLARNGR
jgi:L-malate glycosyltransferase